MEQNFPPPLEELFETFDELVDWEERYEFILDLGRELPALPEALQAPENVVQGCMSQVWLVVDGVASHGGGSPHVAIRADSDSLIVKGLIVILLSLYAGRTAEEIVRQDPQAVFERLGLDQHLSPNRRNGLFSMVGRIRQLCAQMQAAAITKEEA